jgi:hypothetical protein
MIKRQLELSLKTDLNHRPEAIRSHYRPRRSIPSGRASWWFDRMRQAVDGASPPDVARACSR